MKAARAVGPAVARSVPRPAGLALSRFISLTMCFSWTTRNINTTAQSACRRPRAGCHGATRGRVTRKRQRGKKIYPEVSSHLRMKPYNKTTAEMTPVKNKQIEIDYFAAKRSPLTPTAGDGRQSSPCKCAHVLVQFLSDSRTPPLALVPESPRLKLNDGSSAFTRPPRVWFLFYLQIVWSPYCCCQRLLMKC